MRWYSATIYVQNFADIIGVIISMINPFLVSDYGVTGNYSDCYYILTCQISIIQVRISNAHAFVRYCHLNAKVQSPQTI